MYKSNQLNARWQIDEELDRIARRWTLKTQGAEMATPYPNGYSETHLCRNSFVIHLVGIRSGWDPGHCHSLQQK